MTKLTLRTALAMYVMTLPAYAQQNTVPTPDNCEAYKNDPGAYEVLLTQGEGINRIPYEVDGMTKYFSRAPNLLTMIEADGKNIFINKSPVIEALKVELHDPFRNVDLILDVCNSKVLYKDSSGPDFRELYTLGLPELGPLRFDSNDVPYKASYPAVNPARENIGAIGYSSSTKDIAGVLLMFDGNWGEYPRGDDEVWERRLELSNGTVDSATASYYTNVTTNVPDIRKPKFTYTEVDRTDTTILLRDEGRKVDLEVNLDTKVVTYSDSDGKSFPLWIVNSIINKKDLI